MYYPTYDWEAFGALCSRCSNRFYVGYVTNQDMKFCSKGVQLIMEGQPVFL